MFLFRIASFLFYICFFFFTFVTYVQAQNSNTPNLTIQELVTGLSTPWDMAFTPDGTMLFTERQGRLSARLTNGTVRIVNADLSDLFNGRTTGFMSIVVDPNFETNRRFYTYQGHVTEGIEPKVQVIVWTINNDYTQATRVVDPLIDNIGSAVHGAHGGGRIRFGPNGNLWIATGDAVTANAPQDTSSLNGKVLRVNPRTGVGATGNPYSDYPLIYTFGHRNPQGLALRNGTNEMWLVDHGPNHQDEINLLRSGGNYGWDPVASDGSTYKEKNVSMTDKTKFPDAIDARWSSGSSRIAPSGCVFLKGSAWKDWEGRLAVTTLRAQSLRLYKITEIGSLSEFVVPQLREIYGRLRTPVIGPDNCLYIATGHIPPRNEADPTFGIGTDKILKVIPSVKPYFSSNSISVSVAENNNISAFVVTVMATDDDGERLTYELSGQDETSFYISDSSVGEVRARIGLDYENRTSYHVVVTATDPFGLSDEVTVTINVTDVNERLLPPLLDAPMVTRALATSMFIRWDVPTESVVSSYDLRYRQSGTTDFIDGPQDIIGTRTVIYGLNPDTEYEIQVRASTFLGDGDWSEVEKVRTSTLIPKDRFAISLDTDDSEGEQFASFLGVSADGLVSIQIFGKNLKAIPVNDLSIRFEYDATQVVYEGFKRGPVLSGTSALSGKAFVIIGMTLKETIDDSGLMGTLRFRARDTLTETEIRLVRVKLLGEESETIPMYLSVALQGSSVALPVTEPSTDFDKNGIVDIPDYLLFVDVFGSKEGQEGYDAKYDLDKNGEIGIPDFLIFADNFGKEVIHVPVFTSERPVMRFVEENTPAGQPIDDPISATSADGEPLTYSLWGVDANYFVIDASTGQLGTKKAHNYEARNWYSPIVRVSDGKGGQVSVVVGVAIIDVVE